MFGNTVQYLVPMYSTGRDCALELTSTPSHTISAGSWSLNFPKVSRASYILRWALLPPFPLMAV